MELTEHFSDAEMGIAGLDDIRLQRNATYLCEQILEPVRAHYQLPVQVHDGYRDEAHNTRVGGKGGKPGEKPSFHLFNDGKAAADFGVVSVDCRNVFDWIRLYSGLKFDKVILESKGGLPRCVHVQVDCLNTPRRLAYVGETGDATEYTAVEVR